MSNLTNKNEDKAMRLLEAMSGVDSDLLARSEEAGKAKQTGKIIPFMNRYGKILAACLCLAVLGTAFWKLNDMQLGGASKQDKAENTQLSQSVYSTEKAEEEVWEGVAEDAATDNFVTDHTASENAGTSVNDKEFSNGLTVNMGVAQENRTETEDVSPEVSEKDVLAESKVQMTVMDKVKLAWTDAYETNETVQENTHFLVFSGEKDGNALCLTYVYWDETVSDADKATKRAQLTEGFIVLQEGNPWTDNAEAEEATPLKVAVECTDGTLYLLEGVMKKADAAAFFQKMGLVGCEGVPLQ